MPKNSRKHLAKRQNSGSHKQKRAKKAGLKLGPVEAIVIAEGLGRLIDLLSTPGLLGFATAARGKLLAEHENWTVESSDSDTQRGVEAQLRILQDKIFIDDLLRLAISEIQNLTQFEYESESFKSLQSLLVDVYHERAKRHEAHLRLAAFFEKETLLAAVGNTSSAPDRPKGVL
ncbi:hypothetical protein JH314_16725 [Xanthomonas campestris]|uniref:hypothetical protein n=1 Tax=Xanthomonas campestris TaxID=339 RepID=UPI002368E185|nr:hypothetical protein [Xanthomonas campestris]WDJ01002.1 hypothetical protein JH314_16725 [Xanthomonas campestris]